MTQRHQKVLTTYVVLLNIHFSWMYFLSMLRVQRKPIRLSLSSSLPYENITGESTFENSIYETTVSQNLSVCEIVGIHLFMCVCVMGIFGLGLMQCLLSAALFWSTCPSAVFPCVPRCSSLPINSPFLWFSVWCGTFLLTNSWLQNCWSIWKYAICKHKTEILEILKLHFNTKKHASGQDPMIR